MNSYMTPEPQPRGTWAGHVGIKILSSAVVRSQTLFYVENCTRPSDLFANRSRGFFLPYEMASNKLDVI